MYRTVHVYVYKVILYVRQIDNGKVINRLCMRYTAMQCASIYTYTRIMAACVSLQLEHLALPELI